MPHPDSTTKPCIPNFPTEEPPKCLNRRKQSATVTIWPDGQDMCTCLNINSVNMKCDRHQSSSNKR